ncbi:glycosyltransferase [Chlamydiota bacterium]
MQLNGRGDRAPTRKWGIKDIFDMIDNFTEIQNIKVALVHDWLNGMRGGEKCLEQICQWFPDAPIYTLICDKDKLSSIIQGRKIITSKIQKYPFWRKKYRYYLPFFSGAIEKFDFSEYDIVISTSHCVAKSAITKKETCHLCYCFTPMRYVWQFHNEYFKKGFKSIMIKRLLNRLRKWDLETSNRVDYFAAISENVRTRIKQFYKRDSEIIYPPCDTEFFNIIDNFKKDEFYLIVSALVPYKRIDLAIEAFNKLNRPLKIIGGGTDISSLKKIAGNNIEFLGWQPSEVIREYYNKARAVIFPGEEDLGIVPIEAQACGTPVIAYGKGGVLETVIEEKTGLFFCEQEADKIVDIVNEFEKLSFNRHDLRENALNFSKDIFEKRMKEFIIEKCKAFQQDYL